ncbi:MAG: pentapeptide repeat-containing protein [Pirellulaceae bacterium]
MPDCPVLGDTPAHPYTVNLGPGNRDVEKQINAIPWTRRDDLDFPLKDVSHINLSGRDLRLAEIHFELKGLYGANFDDCNLDGSSLLETRFCNCSFRNASLCFCEMDAFPVNTRFLNDFTNADITGTWFGSGFAKQSLEQTRNYREKRLIGVRLFYGGLAGLSFRGAYLESCRLGRGQRAVEDCDFTGATLRRMSISPMFSKEQVYATRNYQNRDLSELLFVGSSNANQRSAAGDFATWDFSNCELAHFANCDLSNSECDDTFHSAEPSSTLSTTPFSGEVILP